MERYSLPFRETTHIRTIAGLRVRPRYPFFLLYDLASGGSATNTDEERAATQSLPEQISGPRDPVWRQQPSQGRELKGHLLMRSKRASARPGSRVRTQLLSLFCCWPTPCPVEIQVQTTEDCTVSRRSKPYSTLGKPHTTSGSPDRRINGL